MAISFYYTLKYSKSGFMYGSVRFYIFTLKY